MRKRDIDSTSEPLGISIGTNELIIVNELTYVKKFVVSVVDQPPVWQSRTSTWWFPLTCLSIGKGPMPYLCLATPTKTGSLPSGDAAVCANEDSNRNGVLETAWRSRDDENVNGAKVIVNGIPTGIPYPDGLFNTRLDPGKSDVSVTLLHAKTRADGTAELQLQYAKSFATWVDARITVAASGVSGTEGRATYLVAPVSADAASFKNVDVTPAYVVSPYGRSSNCANPNWVSLVVALVGMPGGGKSTVGRHLARRLHFSFVDTDDVIRQQVGCPIARFFEVEGEERFRDVESDVLRVLLSQAPDQGRIIATGGGIVLLREENRKLLSNEAVPIYLRAGPGGTVSPGEA